MEIVRLPKVSRRHIASEVQQLSSIPQPAAPVNGVRAAGRPHLRLVGGVPQQPKPGEDLLAEPVAASLVAPERLVADTRAQFRKDAIAYLDRAAAQSVKESALDMTNTTEMDASGLGILVVVQKKAKELGIHMVLKGAPQQVRYLLLLTKLEHLFEFVD
jgi:anti-anti-sigma factor